MQPTKVLPQFDPGDHLHLTVAGYEAMANTIDLALFKSRNDLGLEAGDWWLRALQNVVRTFRSAASGRPEGLHYI